MSKRTQRDALIAELRQRRNDAVNDLQDARAERHAVKLTIRALLHEIKVEGTNWIGTPIGDAIDNLKAELND